MRDAELFRRPPFLTGDEAAVLRHARRFRRRRRAVQLGFVAGVVGLGVALSVLRIPDIAVGAGAFALLSTSFIVLHLSAGKRKWMRPMEAYEDGVVGCEITTLFCRRHFAAWKEVESLDLEPGEGGLKILIVRLAGGRTLESAPGEFEEPAVGKMRERLEAAKEAERAAKALLETVGGDGAKVPGGARE